MKLLVKIRDLSRAKGLCSNDRAWEPEEASKASRMTVTASAFPIYPVNVGVASKMSRSLSSLYL